jgi:serine/threonine-protein kinase
MTRSTTTERLLRAIPARPAAIEPSRELAGWRCERLVGEGRWTRVYAAQAPESLTTQPAPYALRMLRECWEGDPRAIAALRREAWLGEHVSHAHLAPTLASRLVETPLFFVSPLLRGRSLAAMLGRAEAPPLSQALWVARQVAEALEALDDAGWMHADLNPASVFVSPEGHVTVLGLGSAIRIGDRAQLGDRPALGPARYLAPEMFSTHARPDARSDIYSLGVVLMEMLIGQRWGEAPGHASPGQATSAARPRDLTIGTVRRLVPAAPPRLARLISQMVAGDPLRRPGRPRELVDRLASLEIETFAEHLGTDIPLAAGRPLAGAHQQASP